MPGFPGCARACRKRRDPDIGNIQDRIISSPLRHFASRALHQMLPRPLPRCLVTAAPPAVIPILVWEDWTMLTRRHVFFAGAAGLAALALGRLTWPHAAKAAKAYEVTHTDAGWQKLLSPDAYQVLRHEGTERPFTSALLNEHRAGTFSCDGCDLPLYSSKTKFDSGTGWPSFWAPLPNAVATRTDLKMIVPRTEVHCRRCE